MSLSESPESSGDRLLRVTPSDHSAWVWIPTLLAVGHSVFFLAIRLVIKRLRFAIDDVVVGAAYVVAIAHWITTFIALRSGLGKSSGLLTDSEQSRASKSIFTGRLLLLAALCLSKCSVVLLIRYIFTSDIRTAWRSCNTALGLLAAWGILVVLASSAGCSPKSVLAVDTNRLCPNQTARWKLIIALDMVTEVGLVILLTALLAPLNMRRRRKAIVVAAFASRLLNIIFSAFFLSTYLSRLENGLENPSLSTAVPSAWFESMLAYSLISTTVPCLQTFMKSFQTGGVGFTGRFYASGGATGYTGSDHQRSTHQYSTASRAASLPGHANEWHRLENVPPSMDSGTHLRRDDNRSLGSEG